MKNQVMRIINGLERIRETNPRLFKIGLVTLWICAPIEMICIKLGLFGYKKFKQRYDLSRQTQEELK